MISDVPAEALSHQPWDILDPLERPEAASRGLQIMTLLRSLAAFRKDPTKLRGPSSPIRPARLSIRYVRN
jgi:hypothetical protein